MESRPSDAQIALILALGSCLHAAGAPTRRLEATLTRVAQCMSFRVQVFSTATCLIISFGPEDALQTALLRLEPGDLNLGKLIRLDAYLHDYFLNRVTETQLHNAVIATDTTPSALGPLRATTTRAIGAATWSLLLGGGLREASASATAGGLVGLLTDFSQRSHAMTNPSTVVAAILTGATVVVVASIMGPLSTQVANMAALLPLLPGLPLVVGVEEVASRDLLAGASRLASAAIAFLQLAFGVALGSEVVRLFLTVESGATRQTLSIVAQSALLAIALYLLALHFRVDRKDLPWVFAAGAIGYASSRVGTALLGVELGAFVGAFVVGCASNAVARWLDRPALLVTVPGMFSLWPGGLGFQSVDALWSDDPLHGIRGIFSAAMIAVGSVTGLLVASSVLPGRRLL